MPANNTVDAIGNALGLPPIENPTFSVPAPDTTDEDILKGNVDKDYIFARDNLRDLIKSGMSMFEDVAVVASQSQQANTYKAAAEVLKTVVDANQQLLDLSKKHKDLTGLSTTSKTNVTNNNLFVGSTAELQEFLRKKKNGELG